MTPRQPLNHYLKRVIHFVVIFLILLPCVLVSCEEDGPDSVPKYLVAVGAQSFLVEAKENIVETIRVKVLATDSTPSSGVNVFYSVETGSATLASQSMVTDRDGIATLEVGLPSTNSKVRIKAEVPGLENSPLFFNYFITPDVPAAIEVYAGNFQEAQVNTKLPDKLQVKVLDRFGNAVKQVEVTFAIQSGGGKLTWNKSFTSTEGIASAELTTGLNDAVNTVRASIGSLATDLTAYSLIPVKLNKPGAESEHVHVTWTKNVNPTFASYSIFRASGGSYEFQKIGEVNDANVTSFKDPVPRIGALYTYQVKVNTTQGNTVASNQQSGERGQFFELGYEGFVNDIRMSADRATIYIANGEKKIIMLSTATLQKTDSILLPVSPGRIALSVDQKKVYVTAYGGQLLVIDIETNSILHDVSMVADANVKSLGNIHQAGNGQLFASVEGGFIVKIDETDFSTQRVANNSSFFSGSPAFMGDHNNNLYVVESNLSPNSLLKLDLSDSNAPIVKEDEHGSVGGMRYAVLSPDGKNIYTTAGQILNTTDFSSDGTLTGGLYGIQVSATTDRLYGSFYGGSFVDKGTLNIIDRSTLVIEKKIPLGFTASRIFLSQDESFAFLVTIPETQGPKYRIYKIDLVQ